MCVHARQQSLIVINNPFFMAADFFLDWNIIRDSSGYIIRFMTLLDDKIRIELKWIDIFVP